ncbi:MAG: hypothetical protein ACYDGR_06650 [Candidatus Dormibacteria bacterium]
MSLLRARGTARWLLVTTLVVAFLILAGPIVLPGGILIAGLLIGGRPYTTNRMRRWRLWRWIPGLRHRGTARGLAAAIALYAIPLPALVTAGWVAVLSIPDPTANPITRVERQAAAVAAAEVANPLAFPHVVLNPAASPLPLPSDLALAPMPSLDLQLGPLDPLLNVGPTIASPSPQPSTEAPPSGASTPGAPTPGTTPEAASPPPALTLTADSASCVAAGTAERITFHTAPGASVQVVVQYPDGSTNNQGSRTRTADSNGVVVDSWTVSGYASSGRATYAARATTAVQSASAGGEFQVYHPKNGESCP